MRRSALTPRGGSWPSATGRTCCAFVAACALVVSSAGCNVKLAGTRVSLRYTDDARLAYEEAMGAFRSKAWEDARLLFADVKRLFPYTRYARLAELRIADSDFEQAKYADAVALYREFERNHKQDKDVEYARYRMAKALFLDYDSTFLLPPLEERDQSTTFEALRELRGFTKIYTASRYLEDVRYMIEVATMRLVRHELYVARYYIQRENFVAAVARCNYALKTYGGSGMDPETLVLKGETLLKMKKTAEAQEVFEEVVDKYGEPFATMARRFLKDMGAKPKEDKPKDPPPAAKGV